MSSPPGRTTPSQPGQTSTPELLFIHSTRKAEIGSSAKTRIRAQAARAGSQARLESTRRRVGERRRQPGQRVFPVRLSAELQDPGAPAPWTTVEQPPRVAARDRERVASVALHSHTILGGSIPIGQADLAVLGQFLRRFQSNVSTERPWVELVLAEATSSATPTLVSTALQANAYALCANDLQAPEFRHHATKMYLASIKNLQSSLQSPHWRDSIVMHTCMIVALYESIGSNNASARRAHVSGVAYLIQQRGPQSFVHGLEHKTFRYYRITILMNSLADRQPCFLALPQWRTIPFSGDCLPKTMFDVLLDILSELPGLLAAVDSIRKGESGQYALIREATELAYWVRRLISDLERWKQDHLWTHPTVCTAPRPENLDLLGLCAPFLSQSKYDSRLGEALNCYATAHLILARISHQLAARSFVLATVLAPPYSIHDLLTAILSVSKKHIDVNMAGLSSMISMTFPLKVAQNAAEFLPDPAISKTTQELLNRLNHQFATRFNIRLIVSRENL